MLPLVELLLLLLVWQSEENEDSAQYFADSPKRVQTFYEFIQKATQTYVYVKVILFSTVSRSG